MKKFKVFAEEYNYYELLDEDKKVKDLNSVMSGSGANADTKGKLHEILTGYHLLGGKHMSKHPDIDGDSPEEAHKKLKDKISAEDYNHISNRAKEAAEDLRKQIEVGGHKVHDVHWTSKPGDIKRSTGIDSTQKQDASDIMVHTKRAGDTTSTHTGISLKVSDKTNKHVPVSNPGMESTYGAEHVLDAHREHLKEKFPELENATNKESRKELMKSNPKMEEYVKAKNKEVMSDIATHLHTKLSSMSHEDMVQHIKTHVLQSNPTPLQQAGHGHIRHTTYVKKGQNAFHSVDPSTHYEHIFSNPENITIQKSGTSINFLHNGKKFASHRIKFTSQSDPLSGIKGTGTPAGD